MKELEVRKSVWSVINFWSIVSCILIIPIIILVVRILIVKQERIYFYSDRIVVEQGLINRRQKKFAFTGVFSVEVNKTLFGRMFNYGHLNIDFVGKNDISTTYICEPDKVVRYLETKIVKKENVRTYMY